MNKKYYKGRKRNEYDKAYEKEVYLYCKEHHICVACKKEKAEPHSVFCLACKMKKREKARENYKPLTPEKEKAKIERNKQRYNERKAAGICVKCGKRHTNGNGVFCSICGFKRNRKAKEKRIANGVTPRELFGNGEYCSFCGKPTENGNKLCNRCLENSLRTIKIAERTETRFNSTFYIRGKGKCKKN